MDKQVTNCPGLTAADLDLLQRIEKGLLLTTDISRADILVCTLLSIGERWLLAMPCHHLFPPSIAAKQPARTFTKEEQPLILLALTSGSGGRYAGTAQRGANYSGCLSK
ncbi:MAG: hypothetical protein R2932_13240 [Caldilineaceae bacterium]